MESTIVADGAERLREAQDYAAVRRRIVAEVAQRHPPAPRPASFWRQLWQAVKIRREVRAELKKIFPPGALHLVAKAK